MHSSSSSSSRNEHGTCCNQQSSAAAAAISTGHVATSNRQQQPQGEPNCSSLNFEPSYAALIAVTAAAMAPRDECHQQGKAHEKAGVMKRHMKGHLTMHADSAYSRAQPLHPCRRIGAVAATATAANADISAAQPQLPRPTCKLQVTSIYALFMEQKAWPIHKPRLCNGTPANPLRLTHLQTYLLLQRQAPFPVHPKTAHCHSPTAP
jgi:hypothetical protein